jgi:hypothetical protein
MLPTLLAFINANGRAGAPKSGLSFKSGGGMEYLLILRYMFRAF